MTGTDPWLQQLGLSQYAEIFAKEAIDFDVLGDLTDDDLKKLGIPLGHRKRLLKAIAALPGNAPEPHVIGPPGRSSPERRQLTVMFCDLVGSTALASVLDPEDLNNVIQKFQENCTVVVREAGGYIAKYMGDGVLVYFGYPKTHEDEAERAVRAGLHLVALIGQLVLPSGQPLKVRVAIATGTVVVGETVGEGLSQEQAAVGGTLNLAARLQEVARPNTVVITTNTQRLVGGIFSLEDRGLHKLKGIPERVPVWQVNGERVVASRFEATRSTKLTQFVGRQEELRQLMAAWGRATAGSGQLALLCGEAGIGKSRITKTLCDYIASDRHILVNYQCSPYHTNSPFYPVINQIANVGGFEIDDTPEDKLDKLERMFRGFKTAYSKEVNLYAALLSLPTEGRYPDLSLTPQRQKELIIESLVRRLVHLTSVRPVLFVIEDVHWVDPSTLDLISRGVKATRNAPILFVITFRPEFFPPWLNEAQATMLRISRLERNHVAEMILHMTQGKELPADLSSQILNKTDGIPLFVEELTKAVLESGHLLDTGDRYVVGDSRVTPAIPETLRDSLMARLDRLASVKEVPQIGAALGREFSYRLLAAVSTLNEKALRDALDQLVEAELIFARGEPPDSVYTFKHALVQEAAYESQLRSTRQQLHGRIVEVLEERFPELVEAEPEVMAHHLAQAGLTEPAVDYLQRAGQRAIQHSASAEAIRHLERALELLRSLPGSPERTRVACGVQVMLGEAMIAARGYAAPETRQALLAAKALMDESTARAQKFGVLYGIWAWYYVAGEVAMQREAAAEFVAEAERSGEEAPLCLALRALGTTYVTMGDFAAGRQCLEKARALYDSADHGRFRFRFGQDIGATALCYLSWALWHLGYVDQAAQVADEAVQHAEGLSHPLTLAYTICHARGMMDIFRRRPEQTRSYASNVAAICKELGFPFWGAGARILEGWALTCENEVKDGMAVFCAAMEDWRKTGARLWLPMFHALEAEGLAKAGQSDAALQAIERALAVSDETGERWAVAEVLRVKAGLFLAIGRSDDDVEAVLTRSKMVAQEQQARSFELRTTCDLARLWQRQGHLQEAFDAVHAIYEQFTEGFATPDVEAATALLRSLSPDWVPRRDRSGSEQRVGSGTPAARPAPADSPAP